ncbi:MAG: hypothetical protein QNJ41_02545 [Xenococcaceae cyanobacterium MO_188.B32]|nr:hypothetical protein [Xenococcaceae cyanobacterium MO_188.B32]
MSIADTNILNLPKVALEVKQLLPECSGIYYVVDEVNTVWYIGKAKNICKRWQGKAHHRIYQLEAQKKKYFTIYYEKVDLSQLDKIEKQRIKKYHPHLNASPVKTKNVRPTETLLRETIAAISDFAFILGVEPPRKEVESQISMNWMKNSKYKNILELSIIHICLDIPAFKKIFNPDPDTKEQKGVLKTIFNTRKKYASKWEGFPSSDPFMYRIVVNGYAVEKMYWSYVSPRKYIVPAKVNIKLESINYSAWVSFGFCEKYPTFEEAKEEIRQRLKNANLPGLKLTFTRETIKRK